MKVLDLFSGIGGFSLGLERTGGFETVAFCEIDPFCQKVLKKHWPDVPIYNDVRTLDYDGPVDVICGGYPCQPFSTAGKRRGEADDRHLWPEKYRAIKKHKPMWVIGENVRGHVTNGLDTVLLDLEKAGYSWWAGVISASAVGAYHPRERVWFVAHSDSERVEGSAQKSFLGIGDVQKRQTGISFQDNERRFNSHKSRLCRSLHGLPKGVDRVRALGNAVVPQIPEMIGYAILEAEGLTNHENA